MENIQISYDGERVEITFKKGEGVSVCGNSKSWDDRVIPCCMDMEDAISEVFTAEEKEKEGTLAYHLLADYASKASSAEKKKKSVVIDEYLRQKAYDASDRIGEAFVWEQTREGDDYWNKVFWRLRQIAEDGVL